MRRLIEDQKLVLDDCIKRFERLEIPYMLSGSMAMAVYAVMRMTNDIDIVIELKSGDATRFLKVFERDYYLVIERVRDAIDRKRMFNMLHHATIVKVDCVIRKDDAYAKMAFSRRQRIDYAGIDLWIISKEDLILSKLTWARETKSEMQMRDVASIIRNGYDEEYVKQWTTKLGLDEIMGETQRYLERNYVDGHDS